MAAVKLEILNTPQDTPNGPPIVFVHGAYVGAWCWEENFLPWFSAHQRHVIALSLEGHGESEAGIWSAMLGIDNYVQDLCQVTETLTQPPILIGHSMGGFVIQRYLELGHPAAGVVMLASVPGEGIGSSALNMLTRSPDLLTALNLFQFDSKLFQPRLDQMKKLLFSDSMPVEALEQWVSRIRPESQRAILDMGLVGFFAPRSLADTPALVLGGGEDKIIGHSDVLMTAKRFGVSAEIMPNLGHMMMLDTEWEKVAQRIENWLQTTFAATK